MHTLYVLYFTKVTRICVKCMIQHELQHCRKGRSGEEGVELSIKVCL